MAELSGATHASVGGPLRWVRMKGTARWHLVWGDDLVLLDGDEWTDDGDLEYRALSEGPPETRCLLCVDVFRQQTGI